MRRVQTAEECGESVCRVPNFSSSFSTMITVRRQVQFVVQIILTASSNIVGARSSLPPAPAIQR